MKIEPFIQNEIANRLRRTGVLVVYDPERRYRELCLALASAQPERRVIDASENSIDSRALALAALRELGVPNTPLEGLLVYVPAGAPRTDEEKQRDPFALYGACGAVFPDSDGDEYLSLCLKAKPDHAAEIRRIFGDNRNPGFAVIDAVGAGSGWPNLQAVLRVESALDILAALMAPADGQRQALNAQVGWATEAGELFANALGLSLMTRMKDWESVAGELWRFVLYSEFVYDLPAALPEALSNVPRARPEARELVEELCDRLRNDRRTQPVYIERAEAIECALNLPDACQAIDDLGVRDTFPFEERSFFSQAVRALKHDDVDALRLLLARHGGSVWVSRGESRAQWALLQAAVDLVVACEDAERALPEHARSQDALIDFYTGSLREADRLQREFEQAATDHIDAGEQLAAVAAHARAAYRGLIDQVQGLFTRHLETSGWPPARRLANADVFDRLVAPKLQQSGRRVALLLIDSLRYELGVELHKLLAESDPAEVQAAFAALPSVTTVGMAGLLPGAGQGLALVNKNGDMAPVLGDQPLSNVTQRMDVLRRRYGQRFAEMTLADFARGRAPAVPEAADLLVIRSNEIDNELESSAEPVTGAITRTFKFIRVAMHKLRGLGFQDTLIATDHGFYLNTGAAAGDVCAKPPGQWVNVHERMLLGDGSGDAANLVLGAATLGIRGDFNQAALPRAMAAYKAGQWYIHGGASLQEAVVPVISVRLRAAGPAEAGGARRHKVTISYKRGARRITTRVPVVDITVDAQGEMFLAGATFDLLVEAQDKQGNVVGEARPGGPVNPATGTLTVAPGETIQLGLRMATSFEGKFTVKALDPATQTLYARLELETDYTV